MRWEKSDAAPERGIVISSTEEGGKEALIVPGNINIYFSIITIWFGNDPPSDVGFALGWPRFEEAKEVLDFRSLLPSIPAIYSSSHLSLG